MRALSLSLLLVVAAGCGGGEAATVVVTTTVRETTTVEAAATTTEAVPAGEDPAEVGGPLDLRELVAVRFDDTVTVNLRTWEPWDPEILAGPSALVPGPNELTILYDVDLDGKAEYRGRLLVSDGPPVLAVTGQGQAFEPVPILNRPAPEVLEVTHPVDVFYLAGGEGGLGGAEDMQIAATTVFEGTEDRIPDEGWIVVPFRL